MNCCVTSIKEQKTIEFTPPWRPLLEGLRWVLPILVVLIWATVESMLFAVMGFFEALSASLYVGGFALISLAALSPEKKTNEDE